MLEASPLREEEREAMKDPPWFVEGFLFLLLLFFCVCVRTCACMRARGWVKPVVELQPSLNNSLKSRLNGGEGYSISSVERGWIFLLAACLLGGDPERE